MARGPARSAATAHPVEQLPAQYWTSLTSLRWPGSPHLRIDEVLIGPSGVHFVLQQPAAARTTHAAADGADDELENAATLAAAGAAAVGDLLPVRYRNLVSPAVRLTDTQDDALSIGTVLVASPGVLRHAWRHGPRVLSTSEATEIAGRLRAVLEPFPIEPPTETKRRWRWRRPAPAVTRASAGPPARALQ
jgi:hypothetical protein